MVLIFILSAVIFTLALLLLRSIQLRERGKQQYHELMKRYEEEVLSNLTQRELWLYELESIQSHLIFHIIHLLPEEEAHTFKRRQADLNHRIESTRHQSTSQLSVEQMLLEDDLRAFKNDLLMALKETFY